jgi:hypothetical protein
MNPDKKPTITPEIIGKNPFLGKLEIHVNRVVSKNKFKHDKKEDIWLPADDNWEAVSFTRVYADSDRRLQMVELTPRGKDLLLWLIYEAETNLDYLWINKRRYMKECSITSLNTYKSALNDLIKNGYILATVVANTYWLNPHHFFNGNRIKKFPDNVVER